MTDINEVPDFVTIAEALLFYQSQGNGLDESIRLAYRHKKLVKDWVEKMQAIASKDI